MNIDKLSEDKQALWRDIRTEDGNMRVLRFGKSCFKSVVRIFFYYFKFMVFIVIGCGIFDFFMRSGDVPISDLIIANVVPLIVVVFCTVLMGLTIAICGMWMLTLMLMGWYEDSMYDKIRTFIYMWELLERYRDAHWRGAKNELRIKL